MVDEQNTAPVTPQVTAQPKQPEFNIDDINKEIDAANKKIVSDEVAKLIASEKEKARQEAEKEFLINQKLKDKEAEIERMKQTQLEKERQAAEQLEILRRKVDELAASKQPVAVQNPFGSQPSQTSASQASNSSSTLYTNIKEDQMEEIEKASFIAMLERKLA